MRERAGLVAEVAHRIAEQQRAARRLAGLQIADGPDEAIAEALAEVRQATLRVEEAEEQLAAHDVAANGTGGRT
ncbi:hypothetical protein U5903_15185 [Cereibacter johrii]|uniref:hypothetical protein n=1 Tax=Cereibacter johrii TaxID=445629 RepID=UPI002B261732|nr:hypothetical protein [Cereibacter johrii]MEA5162122.1 hypothetical protein [Cereibacter johrii]